MSHKKKNKTSGSKPKPEWSSRVIFPDGFTEAGLKTPENLSHANQQLITGLRKSELVIFHDYFYQKLFDIGCKSLVVDDKDSVKRIAIWDELESNKWYKSHFIYDFRFPTTGPKDEWALDPSNFQELRDATKKAIEHAFTNWVKRNPRGKSPATVNELFENLTTNASKSNSALGGDVDMSDGHDSRHEGDIHESNGSSADAAVPEADIVPHEERGFNTAKEIPVSDMSRSKIIDKRVQMMKQRNDAELHQLASVKLAVENNDGTALEKLAQLKDIMKERQEADVRAFTLVGALEEQE